MKIIYCSWNENSKNDLYRGLCRIADEVVKMEHCVKEYLGHEADEELTNLLDGDVDAVVSFDFYPAVSNVCSKKNVPYVAWVYDWPHYTIFEPEIYNACNHVFLFEKSGIEQLLKYRADRIQYSPLAVDCGKLSNLLGDNLEQTDYQYEVSFVGNMYLNLKDAMMTEHVPEYYEGFVRALTQAQQKIYGYNFANDIITKEFAQRYLEEIHLEINGVKAPKEYILATQINKYITGVERRNLLQEAARVSQVHLFTQSKVGELGDVVVYGGVDYDWEMPKVFRRSKINLNITLRSITTGVPLRVFDILGAGGFCLTNYQEQIAEHFEDGKDLVMFTGPEDMQEKITYYLTHEEERMAIAKQGYQTIKAYDYEKVLRTIMEKSL